MAYEGKGRRWAARRSIIATYAGAEAERAVLGDVWKPGIGDDEEQAFWISREFRVFPRHMQSVGEARNIEYLEKLRGEAARLAAGHRNRIVQLADLLMKRKTLGRVQVERLIGIGKG